MKSIKSPKLLPLYVLFCIASIPCTFLYALHYFFGISDLQKLMDFGLLIVQNLSKPFMGENMRPMKLQVYASLALSPMPALLLTYLLSNKKLKTTHGKAVWAGEKDIESYRFSFQRWIKGIIGVCNPLAYFSIKSIQKAWKEFFHFGFALTTPLLNMNFSRGGFLLGIYKELWSAKHVYYDAPLSALIVAPPGAGKSTAVAIPNLLTLPTSCVVLDIKGELCDLTAGYRQKALKNEIYVFNPFGNDNNLKFNPFDKKIVSKLDFNGKKRLVDEIANTIFVEEQGQDPHWIAKAKELFVFYALYDVCTKNESNFFDIATGPVKDYKPLIQKGSRFYEMLWEIDENTGEKSQIPNVEPERLYYQQCADQKYLDVTNPKNWQEESPEQVQANARDGVELLDEVVRNCARALAQAGSEEFASIKSTFNRVMSVFYSYQVKDVTDSMSFEYEDLRRKNITIYIKIAQTDIDTLKSLIRVLLESIAKNLMIKESSKPAERIYLILDEFIRFGKMPFLLEMPALCRSYGVVPLYITQSYGLIKKYYGEDDLKTMTDTIAFQILFKMNDADSAENVSKQIGKYTRENRNYNTKENAFLGGSSSYSLEGTDLLSAQDILNIPDDSVIILVSGHKAKPVKLFAAKYYENKDMLKRIKWSYDPNNTELLAQAKKSAQESSQDSAKDPIKDMVAQAPKQALPPQAPMPAALPIPPAAITPPSQESIQEFAQEKQEPQTQGDWEHISAEVDSMANLPDDAIEAEILRLQSLQDKEYTISVDDKLINTALQAPYHTKNIPLNIYKDIHKNCHTLVQHGFMVHITDSHIKSQGATNANTAIHTLQKEQQ